MSLAKIVVRINGEKQITAVHPRSNPSARRKEIERKEREKRGKRKAEGKKKGKKKKVGAR